MMISAMPAVAVRRGRKKSKTFGRFGKQPPSHHSSIASLSKNRNFAKRAANQSISTISSTYEARTAAAMRRRYAANEELQRQRRRFLIYLGTIFLITGLLLVFIGVGAAVSTAQTVGLLLIGIGAVLCIIKVFCSEAHVADVPKTLPVQDGESGDSAENVGASSDNTPVAEVSEFTALQTQSGSPTQDSNPTANNHPNNLTPTSLNSIPETQVLITEEAERF